jgi:hypothetical protein
MANELWLKPMGSFLLNSWLSVCVPLLGVPMNHIFLLSQRVRELALDFPCSTKDQWDICPMTVPS